VKNIKGGRSHKMKNVKDEMFTVRWKNIDNKLSWLKFKFKNEAEEFIGELEKNENIVAIYPLWDENKVMESKEYTVKFIVHKNGAVVIDKVRYGSSTWIARCLGGIARSQDLDRKES
jgi:hypothetical protein